MTEENRPAGIGRRDLLAAATVAGAGAAILVAGAGNVGAARAATGPAPMWTLVPLPPQVPAKEGLADLPGTRLWYWDTGGTGAPVIFMHAGTGSGHSWGYQQPVFAKAGYRAIGYSRRGYRGSDAGDNSSPGVASEDLGALIGVLGLDRVHLVAAAHGGYFAIDYALSHPDKVRSLTVLSSLMGIRDADYREVNARLRPKFFADLPHDFKELGPSYRAGDPAGLEAWNKLVHEAIPGTRIDPKLAHEITWAALETIRVPTLLMTGDADLYTPPSLLRMQAAHIPHAQVEIIPEAAHSANWERPEHFNRLVLDFIAKHH